MMDRQKIEKYYNLYTLLRQDERMKLKVMAQNLGQTGLGRTYSAINKNLRKMYDLKISLRPKLVLKTFDNVYSTALFCKKFTRDNISQTYFELKKDPELDYILFMAGDCDFFITTKKEFVNVNKYDIEIVDHMVLYETVYTVPLGYNMPMRDALHNFSGCDFEKGILSRESHGLLHWSDIDWKIFFAARENAQRPFAHIGKEVGVTGFTAQKHYYEAVYPMCSVAHYFFPQGYDYYRKAFFRIKTEYEKGFLRALQKLPCTSYILPFENSLGLVIFHENVNELMTAIRKIEEKGFIDTYSLFIPLSSRI